MSKKQEKVMSESIDVQKSGSIYLVKNKSELTATKLLEEISDFALNQDLVQVGYKKAILSREKKYPTGLNGFFGMAIPHTDQYFIKKTALIIVLNEHPVIFKSMVDKTKNVDVSIVFSIFATEGSTQVRMLEKLSTFMQNEKMLNQLVRDQKIDILANELL